ncbi:hypothetical protein BU23DRAFT_560775 [Bimuria novae-zelandiae CBS 107.79]|uniref:Uncharacterized protein n=1 Tax=Bimuria novae-zelandiae CBS 107.79 TaxID=1447943 RepID=A0A6A5UPV1_9PLEO|nr:hypothetical protein BU23DRAFT_560775 [Bimuria novae-zelandiae CBS 107.79]
MAVCRIEGNNDMYGLGIRLGYYLQWYGAILARWIAPSEVKNLASSLDLFAAATFLALIILTANDINILEPVETYIVLLLMFGAYLVLVPIYIWRLLTGCDPYWDPTRYPRVNLGAFSATLSFMLLIGVLIFQYWFWFDRVPDLDTRHCQQYGFVIGQVRLNSKVSVVLHALMYFWLGLVCLYILLLKFRALAGFPDPGARSRRAKKAHIELLQNLDVWIKIVVALAVTVATELTISWNEIRGVGTLSGAGQTIPFAIGLGAIVRVIYVAMAYESDYTPPPRPITVSQVPDFSVDEESIISRPSRVRRRSVGLD